MKKEEIYTPPCNNEPYEFDNIALWNDEYSLEAPLECHTCLIKEACVEKALKLLTKGDMEGVTELTIF